MAPSKLFVLDRPDIQYLKAFFNAEEHGIEHGVPLAVLQSGPYREILMAGQNLDL